MVCDAHLFVLPIHTQAGLELAAAEKNVANFSQYSMAWEVFHGLWVQDVTEFDSD
jgi:hypothetical protein